jgi:hypothetical protein
VDTFSHFSIDENSHANAAWGPMKQRVEPGISSVVFDQDGDAMTFSVASTDDSLSYTVEGNYIMVEGSFNTETRPFHYMTLEAFDGKDTSTMQFLLLVNDKNDPPVPRPGSMHVEEMADALTSVGAPLVGAIFDEDDTSFTFVGDSSNIYFDIEATTGQIFVKSVGWAQVPFLPSVPSAPSVLPFFFPSFRPVLLLSILPSFPFTLGPVPFFGLPLYVFFPLPSPLSCTPPCHVRPCPYTPPPLSLTLYLSSCTPPPVLYTPLACTSLYPVHHPALSHIPLVLYNPSFTM